MKASSFVETLLSKMTLEEKVGQMTQLSIDTICFGEPYQLSDPLQIDPAKLDYVVKELKVGSILNVGIYAHPVERWQELIGAIQEAAAHTQLSVPILYGVDSIHGANYTQGSTLFPQQLGLAATYNTDLAEQLAAVSAYETRASGIPWTFSPVLDLGRQALWPRLWETFGEDVHLTTQMGLAMVKGYEGEDIAHPHRVASCLKHYAGYGFSWTGHDRTPVYLGERQLREYHLAPFAAAIKAGAATIMINSGEINGIPVHASRQMLTDILRDEMGFEGIAVTDWEDIRYLHTRHRVADNHKEAVRMAIEAGVDMSMVPMDATFTTHLIELVKEGTISEERLDVSVRRILRLKERLGLFEKTHQPLESFPEFAAQKSAELSRQAARESLILLKNEGGQLPLDASKTVLVCGPTADSMVSLNGGWSYTWQGERSDEFAEAHNSILQAVVERIGADKVRYVRGCSHDEIIDLEEAQQAAEEVDQIILCLGEQSYTEFFGNLNDLYLPDAQMLLTDALLSTGKPITLVLAEGRPRLIREIEPSIPSILLSLYPGNEGGNAIADVLYGDTNPSGKLPITYPRFPNALHTYDHKYSELQSIQGAPRIYAPQFEFGHGLSYTQFSYHSLALDKSQYAQTDRIHIKVDVENSGPRKGQEVVQVFVSDLYASITPPVRRLRAFSKITLEPGERQTIEIELAVSELAFVDLQNQWRVEAGDFTLRVANLEAAFKVTD
ncbi:MAG: glycoside hydrolase family 3 N-terminal domain-containing protein [Bacteroidota bacterium]